VDFGDFLSALGQFCEERRLIRVILAGQHQYQGCFPRVGEIVRRSVSRVLSPPALQDHLRPRREMAIHLGRPLPSTSRDLPGQQRENTPAGQSPACRPYSVLLPVGFALPPPLPAARCALTAPFHPYPSAPPAWPGASKGGLLSVALSLGSPPPGVTRHRVSVEPGLSSRRRFPICDR